MNPLPFILGPDFISVISNGAPHTIYSNDARFAKLKTAIKEKNWDSVPQIVSLPRAIALFSSGNIQVFEGQVVYKDRPVHNSITERILEFIREGFPFEPLVRFMDKLMDNPSERSREQLHNYLLRYFLPIGDSGCFYAVKAVQKDTFLDLYSKTICNKPGANPKMDRSDCNQDDEVGCAKSFHAGNYEYVKSYGSPEDEVVLVEIEPQNVVACPKDCSYQKLRVCEYKVVGHIGKVKDLEGFNSNYAPKNEIAGEIITKNKPESEIIPTNGEKVGCNRAYELHKNGWDVQSLTVGVVKYEENKPRKFFRQYKDWYQI
jgi:hypothetical protein